MDMTKHDRIVADLVDALDAIERATLSDDPHALAYIQGMAQQAQKNVNAQRELNSDGYLVVRS